MYVCVSATCRSICIEFFTDARLRHSLTAPMEGTTTLAVHRCRFVDFSPSSVTALAFPPLPLLSAKGKQKATVEGKAPMFAPLVVGRANGNIEIYEWTGSAAVAEAPQAWVLRKVREHSLDPLVPH